MLLFPSIQARKSILDIHTSGWRQRPSEALKQELAAAAVGFCGADLKALCTEASLHALRRRWGPLLVEPCLCLCASLWPSYLPFGLLAML